MKYYTITPDQAKRMSYLKTLRDEIVTWGNVDEKGLNSLQINHIKILEYRKRMMGFSGPVVDYADWTRFMMEEYGPQKRCLSLGSGVGRVEKYLVSIGFAEKMETLELCADVNEAARLKDLNIDTQVADLNFMDLQPNSYDFILCHCVLHHLINVEHVLSVINGALRQDGLVLIYEFVGDSRWQFTKQRLDFLRERFPGREFHCLPPWAVEGFEAVRSGDLFGLIQDQFGDTCIRSVGFGGVYFPFINCSLRGTEMPIDEVIKVDEEVAREGVFTPCYYMGLFGKSNKVLVPPRRWSDAELDSRLMPPVPILVRARRSLSHSSVGPFLRWAKRMLSHDVSG